MARTSLWAEVGIYISFFSARTKMKDACVDRLHTRGGEKKSAKQLGVGIENRWNNNGIKNALSATATERLFMLLGTRSPSASTNLFMMYERPTHWPYNVNKLLLLLFAAKLYDVHNGNNINDRHRRWAHVRRRNTSWCTMYGVWSDTDDVSRRLINSLRQFDVMVVLVALSIGRLWVTRSECVCGKQSVSDSPIHAWNA